MIGIADNSANITKSPDTVDVDPLSIIAGNCVKVTNKGAPTSSPNAEYLINVPFVRFVTAYHLHSEITVSNGHSLRTFNVDHVFNALRQCY